MRAPTLAFALATLALHPALAQAPACPFPGQTPMLLVRLYLGQKIDGGGVISRLAWQRFVAERITPALPDGFTVLDAYGQYRDRANGRIGRESTEIVEVAAPDTPTFRARIADLAEAYKRQFSQSAVGLVSQPVCGLF